MNPTFHIERKTHLEATAVYFDCSLFSFAFLKWCALLKKRIAIIADHHVAWLYGRKVERLFASKYFRGAIFPFTAGEKSKTRQVKEEIEDRMLQAHFGRDSIILTLGGGVTTDLGGFIAANYLRGIPYFSIPTSLMAMVDASFGGKTGVNTLKGKNMIGSFYSPFAIFIDIGALKTLPDREMQNGMAEIIKYGLIADASLFYLLRANYIRWQRRDISLLREVVHRCLLIKRSIIAKDPYEKGIRKLLNFGHTIAHAIECAENYQISHGQAVAMGIVVESLLSYYLGGLSLSDVHSIYETVKKVGFSLTLSASVTVEQLFSALQQDKKVVSGKVRFVSLDSIGKAKAFGGSYCTVVEKELLLKVLNWMVKEWAQIKETKTSALLY